MSNDEARRLAEVASLNPLEVIAELEIGRAADAATRTAWGKALASMRGSASVLLLAICFALTACGGWALHSGAHAFLKVIEIVVSIIFIM